MTNNKTDRIYLDLLIVFLFLTFGTLYLAFTLELYAYNYIWFMLLLLLLLFSFMRDLLPAMLASIFVAMGYASYIMYKMFFEQSVAEIVLNDVVWLFFYPAGAFSAGLLGRNLRQLIQQHNYYADNYEKHTVMDDATGFLNARNFKEELADEVSRSIRYHRTMGLLLMEIPYFRELRQEYGREQAQEFLRKVAEQMDEVLRDVDIKGHIDEGLFGAILPETPAQGIAIVQARLLEKFQTIAMTRVKREVKVKVKLRFGSAVCPEQGAEADALYDKARQELSLYVS